MSLICNNEIENEERQTTEVRKFENFECNIPGCNKTPRPIEALTKGDLYILGSIWIAAMRCVLVGTDFNLFPVIHARKDDDGCPKRPPPMRYKDLPLYDAPHANYKNYEESKNGKCCGYKRRLLHEAILPSVRSKRKEYARSLCFAKIDMNDAYNEITTDVSQGWKDFKKYFRDPKKLQMRQAVVAAGSLTGFLLAVKHKRGIPGKLFYTGFGAFAAGSLCFPKETDEYFRTFLYHTHKVGKKIYNTVVGEGLELRERIPCKVDMPTCKKDIIENCPKKK